MPSSVVNKERAAHAKAAHTAAAKAHNQCSGNKAGIKGSRKKLARSERLVREKERAALVAAVNSKPALLHDLTSLQSAKCEGLNVQVTLVEGEEVRSLQGRGISLCHSPSETSRLLLLRAPSEDAPAEPAPLDAEDGDWVFVDAPEREADAPAAEAEADDECRPLDCLVHFRFCVDNKRAVLLVLEFALAAEAPKGLGQFAMEALATLAREHGMSSLLLSRPAADPCAKPPPPPQELALDVEPGAERAYKEGLRCMATAASPLAASATAPLAGEAPPTRS